MLHLVLCLLLKNFVMLLVGGAECFAAGWVYNIREQIDSLGHTIVFSYMSYMGTTFGSVILACAIWFGLNDKSSALWAGFVALGASYVAGMTFVVSSFYFEQIYLMKLTLVCPNT